MPRKQVEPRSRTPGAKQDLAAKLAAELQSSREAGQPLIYERTYLTGKASVNVLWDAWEGVSMRQRSATILRAYELAEGRDALDRVLLVNGLTIPEAHASGMLPYRVLAAVRRGDPVTPEQARDAMLEEGGSALVNPPAVQLRFATEEEAEAARRRLIQRFPGSDEVWLIDRDVTPEDFDAAELAGLNEP